MNWLEPWQAVAEGAVEESLRAELRREVPPGHVLHGVEAVRAIGTRSDQDDVAYLLSDGRVAVVHLTWARRQAVPPDPATRVLPSLEALARWMEAEQL